MGRGNWCLGQSDVHRLVYVEVLDVGNRYDSDDIDYAYADFYRTLKSAFPGSFDWLVRGVSCDGRDHSRMRDGGYSRDEMIVAENRLYEVVMDSDGDFWHQGLAIVVKENAPAFAHFHLNRLADRVFTKLAESYNLSVRCCAWTSGPYVPPSK